MAYQRNPNDPYRFPDDPYRGNAADDEYRRAARLDNELQMDPELAEGPASSGRVAMFAVAIAVVLWFNVKDATEWSAAPLLGLYWCAIGLVIAIAASRIAKRVGESLTRELDLTAKPE